MRIVLDEQRMASGGARLLPWYFGAAYYDVSRAQTIYYPMPINWIVRWWMAASWAWLQFRHEAPAWVQRSEIDFMIHSAFEHGREVGAADGYKRGLNSRVLAAVASWPGNGISRLRGDSGRTKAE